MATTGTTGTLFRHHEEFYYGGEETAKQAAGTGEGQGRGSKWNQVSELGQVRERCLDWPALHVPLPFSSPAPPLPSSAFDFFFCLFRKYNADLTSLSFFPLKTFDF